MVLVVLLDMLVVLDIDLFKKILFLFFVYSIGFIFVESFY